MPGYDRRCPVAPLTLPCEVHKLRGLFPAIIARLMGWHEAWGNPQEKRKGDVMVVIYFIAEPQLATQCKRDGNEGNV